MAKQDLEVLAKALDRFVIEIPSWGFADTGTRFGKYFQDAAASTVEEKFHDAGLVHRLTGACPTVAVHVLWDFQQGQDPKAVTALARKHGIAIGSINPNVFQDQIYKLGSFCSPWKEARQQAVAHSIDCVKLGQAVGSKVMSMWLADGTNYPGQDNIITRKHRLEEGLGKVAAAMRKNWKGAKLLLEYKPFEPGFYHTDVADWGMAASFCRTLNRGGKADCQVLVDTGHHLPASNIEHIVAFLLDEGLLGGFHFNDRKYADDDLTLGSIDPYAAFRIFNQIAQYEFDTGKPAKIEYMIDQSHNLKPKLEAMVQTVMTAQMLYTKAQLVDRKALALAQEKGDIVAAEMLLRQAYETDVTAALVRWRKTQGLAADPLHELRRSGIIDKLGKERAAARKARGVVQGSSYA